jgi:hypothetical protein
VAALASNLGVLTIDLVAKIGGFVEGLSKAERESKKFRASVESNLKAAGVAFAALGIAGAAATAKLVKASIDNADALLEQSQAYGVTVETLSAYQLGLEQAGASSTEFATGLKGLANAVDADAEAFKRLQISTKDAQGALKSSDQLLGEIADRFASMEDGITKTALAQDLFGKSGVKLIPFLNEGADGLKAMREEAERLGLVISTETAEAADEFNDSLATMKGVIKGAGNEIAAALLPKMAEFTALISDPEVQEGLKDLIVGMADLTIKAVELAAALPNVARFLQESFGKNYDDFFGLNNQLDDLNAQIEELQNRGPINLFFGTNEEERIARLKKERDAVLELLKAYDSVKPPTAQSAASDPAKPFVALPAESSDEIKAATDAQNEFNKAMEAALDEAEKTLAKLQAIDDARITLNEGMERELALHGETSQAAILRYDIEHGELAALTEENKAYSIALAEQLDAKKALADQAANDEQFAAKEAALQKEIDLLGNVSEAAELLYDIEHGGYEQFDEDQQAKLVVLAEELEAREAMMQEIEAQEKAKAEIMEEFADRTQNILADFLKGSFDDGFKGVVDRFKTMLADMAAEAVAADIMKFVVGLGKNKSGGGNGWGQAISAFAGFFDTGGSIGAGQWGIAGENGAEIIRGPANITSTKDTAAMMGRGAPVTNNYNVILPNARTKQEGDEAGSAFARRQNRMNSGSGRYQ